MSQLRIFLADANRDSRLGMQMLLDHQTGMRIVGVSVGSEGLVVQAGAAQPDVVLLDWQIIASAPAEYIKNLHSIESQLQIIVLHIRPEIRREAEDAGADAFIGKDTPPDELLLVLRKIGKDKLEGKK
jgi:DNA-binding NarL/FixJ family response regulator